MDADDKSVLKSAISKVVSEADIDTQGESLAQI